MSSAWPMLCSCCATLRVSLAILARSFARLDHLLRGQQTHVGDAHAIQDPIPLRLRPLSRNLDLLIDDLAAQSEFSGGNQRLSDEETLLSAAI